MQIVELNTITYNNEAKSYKWKKIGKNLIFGCNLQIKVFLICGASSADSGSAASVSCHLNTYTAVNLFPLGAS